MHACKVWLAILWLYLDCLELRNSTKCNFETWSPRLESPSTPSFPPPCEMQGVTLGLWSKSTIWGRHQESCSYKLIPKWFIPGFSEATVFHILSELKGCSGKWMVETQLGSSSEVIQTVPKLMLSVRYLSNSCRSRLDSRNHRCEFKRALKMSQASIEVVTAPCCKNGAQGLQAKDISNMRT